MTTPLDDLESKRLASRVGSGQRSGALRSLAALSAFPSRNRSRTISIQDKTELIRWSNRQLTSHEYKPLTHLEAEIADGKTLLRLVQIVVDETLPRHYLRPQKRSQKVDNLRLCLKFLKERDFDVTGIQAEEIADGNTSAIFTVLQVLKDFEGATGELRLPPAEDQLPSSGLLSIDKEDIVALDWVSNLVQRTVADYSSFTDGRLLCDVVNCLSPGAIALRSVGGSLPSERIQMAFVAGKRHLDVPVPAINPRDVIFERAGSQLRNYLLSIRGVAEKRARVREEERVKSQMKRQLEVEKSRFEARERRIQQQQSRALERRHQHVMEFEGDLSGSQEILDPVENVSHQFQREQELAKRVELAQKEQKQSREELRESEDVKASDKLLKEQKMKEQLQQARIEEMRKKQLEDERQRRDQLKARRQSQQQLYIERHKQQLDGENDDVSDGGGARSAAAARLKMTLPLKSSRRMSAPPDDAERRQAAKQKGRRLARSGRGRGGLKRKAASLSDFRSAMTLTPIEEEKKSSGSSTPSSDGLGRLERRASESNLHQSERNEPDPTQYINVDKAVIASMRRDLGLAKRPASKISSKESTPSSAEAPSVLSAAGDKATDRTLESGRFSAREQLQLEERLLVLEEENQQIKSMFSEERQRRLRRLRSSRRRGQRKHGATRFASQGQVDFVALARQKIEAYDTCILAFARKLASLESELAFLHQQAATKVSDTATLRSSGDAQMVKALGEKVESLEKETGAQVIRAIVEEMSLLKGQLHQLEEKRRRKDKLSGKPLLGKLQPFSRKSRLESTREVATSPNASESLFQLSHTSDLDTQYSQSAIQLRHPAVGKSEADLQSKRLPSEDIRRRSYVKLANFFGEDPPSDSENTLHVFLDRLGYGHFIDVFKREQISMVELSRMSEEHLSQLGIPLGPRVVLVQEIRKQTT